MRRERPQPGDQPGRVFRFLDKVAVLDVAPSHSLVDEIAVELFSQPWRDSDLDRAELSQQPGVAIMKGPAEFALQFSFDLCDLFRQAVSQEQVITSFALRQRRQKGLKASRHRESFKASAHEVFIQLLSD